MYVLLGMMAVCFATAVSAQMCQNSGQECFTHSDCCGGCCRQSICIDSMRECATSVDDCEISYCPAGFICSLYQVPGCPGCQIVRYCRPAFLDHHAETWRR